MEHIEMVERLHEKAKISYSDAKDALEKSGWDMLEAIVLLEKEGKIDPLTASTTSTDSDTSYEEVKATASKKENVFNEAMNNIGEKAKNLFNDSIATFFVVKRQGKELIRVQVLIAVIICLCAWEFVLAALIIGLLFDCRYTIDGRDDDTAKTDSDDIK